MEARVLAGIALTEEAPVPTPTDKEPFWRQPAIWVTAMLMPLVYFVTIVVLLPSNNYSTEVKVVVITAIISGVLGAVVGFWLATSYSSGKKDDLLAATRPPDPSPTTTNIITQPDRAEPP